MDGVKLYFKLKGQWNESRDIDPPFDSLDHAKPRPGEREDVRETNALCVSRLATHSCQHTARRSDTPRQQA